MSEISTIGGLVLSVTGFFFLFFSAVMCGWSTEHKNKRKTDANLTEVNRNRNILILWRAFMLVSGWFLTIIGGVLL